MSFVSSRLYLTTLKYTVTFNLRAATTANGVPFQPRNSDVPRGNCITCRALFFFLGEIERERRMAIQPSGLDFNGQVFEMRRHGGTNANPGILYDWGNFGI